MNLYKNEHDFGYLIAQAKNDKPLAIVEMGIDDKKMDIFVGLKQANLVAFSVSRKVSRMVEPVDDILATVELSSDGKPHCILFFGEIGNIRTFLATKSGKILT